MSGSIKTKLIRSLNAALFLLASATVVGTGQFSRRSFAADQLTIDTVDARKSCGRKALLAWLRLLERNAQYEEIVSVVPVGEQGTSLDELSQGAARWLDGASIVRIGDDRLESIPLPAIAHGWLDGEEATQGHYVVIAAVRPTDVVCLDVVSGTVECLSRSTFQSFSSGYFVIAQPASTLLARCFYLGSAGLSLIVGLLVVRYGRGLQTRIRPHFAILIACMLSFGCMPAHEGGKSAVETADGLARSAQAFKVSSSQKDLGTIVLGEEARAVFTLSNVSNAPIDLTLGRPSCGCLTASLDRERLDPGLTAQLELVLSGNRRGYVGRTEGSISVGTAGSEAVHLFTAKGVIEGMYTSRYAMRLPPNPGDFSPDPIKGEIAVGLKRLQIPVKIREVRLENGSDFVEFEAPILSELEKMTTHGRYSFIVPVHLRSSVQARTDSIPARITYSIGETVSDHLVAMNVFPLASESSGQSAVGEGNSLSENSK